MREHALADIEVSTSRGLEIGPLARPIVSKAAGSVFYVDHADRDELRRKYAADANMAPLIDCIVEVDYVVRDGRSLVDVVGPDGPFDYIIACHVIEHIPDIVTWLREMSALLAPDGVLSLVVPDKRYVFDVNRAETDVSQLVDAYINKAERPTIAQSYDSVAKALNGIVDPAEAWAGKDYSDLVRTDCDDPDLSAWRFCNFANTTDDFVDVHCHVFSPQSFLTIVEKLIKLGLFPYVISSFFTTEVNDIEFFASLRRLPEEQQGSPPLARQLESVAAARSQLRDEGRKITAARSGRPNRSMEVSDLERRAIEAKRAVMRAVRALTVDRRNSAS